jgi:hypothetical protein
MDVRTSGVMDGTGPAKDLTSSDLVKCRSPFVSHDPSGCPLAADSKYGNELSSMSHSHRSRGRDYGVDLSGTDFASHHPRVPAPASFVHGSPCDSGIPCMRDDGQSSTCTSFNRSRRPQRPRRRSRNAQTAFLGELLKGQPATSFTDRARPSDSWLDPTLPFLFLS